LINYVVNPQTITVDSVYGPVDLFHVFFNRKINPRNWGNRWPPYFYKKTPKLFQNYIFTLDILHLGL
jgi:hypothetical protein